MNFRRWSGLAGLQLGAAALVSAAALAQVSGDIMVGRVASPAASHLVPALRAPDGPVPDAQLPVDLPRDLPGAVAEPEPILLPQPLYPRAARAARQEGRVLVCFTLDEQGLVHAPAVRASTDPVFNQPVLDAITASRFTPARVGKQAVQSTACRTFQFVLR